MELILERNNRFIKLWLQFFFSVVIHPSLIDLFGRKVLVFSLIDQKRALFHHVYFDGPRQTRGVFWPKLILLFSFSLSSFLQPFFQPSPPTPFLIPDLHYVSQSVSDVRAGCVRASHSPNAPLLLSRCSETDPREGGGRRRWTAPPLLTSKDGNAFSFLRMNSGTATELTFGASFSHCPGPREGDGAAI